VVAALFLYMAGFGLTLGPIVWLYIPEIVEPRIIPYSTMTNLLGASVCIIIFPIASAQLPNKAYLFIIFLIWAIVSMIINQKYLVETKDKTREQVYREQN
jgi:p-aminobenzoyl-glutamate transporter AbgT